VTAFGSHRRNTDRSLKVSISSYRHRSDLVRYRNGSGETIVVEEEQSLVVGLWGHSKIVMKSIHVKSTIVPSFYRAAWNAVVV